MNNHLYEILQQQKQAASQLEVEIKNIENLDLTKQNASLTKEAEKLNEELLDLREKIDTLNKSNSELREAIYSRLYSEKLNLINSSEKKMEVYFSRGRTGEYNRLTDFENQYKELIDTRINEIKNRYSMLNNELRARVAARTYDLGQELAEELKGEIVAAKQALTEETQHISNSMSAGYQGFRSEEISEQEIRAISGQNKLERFLGLNVLNKIGIGFILLGVIFASQYFSFGGGIRAAAMFALGLAMVGVGEFIGRKKSNVFSLGVIAGGVAVTYIALTVSYFMYGLFEAYAAAAICIAITGGAFFLSIRHNSQVIATFSLIGGFLPIFAVQGAIDYTLTYSAMAYFVILGMFTLILSFKEKWIVTAFFGLFLNIISTIYIASFFDHTNPISDKLILISYMAVSFMTYTLIPIIGTYVKGLSFKASDITLIALNTFFSTVILCFFFRELDIADFNGLIPLVFMLIYIGLTMLLKLKMNTERDMRALFVITSMVFFILIIPMHFDTVWLSLGWLLQGIGVTIYGILAEKRKFTIAGFIINGLCLFAFTFVDLSHAFIGEAEHFELKYLLITLSAVSIIAAFTYKRIEHGGALALKYMGTVNLWCFLLYIIGRWNSEARLYLLFENIYSIICIVMTFTLLFALPRIKPVYDSGMRVISHGLGWIGIGWLFILNFMTYDFSHQATNQYMIGALLLAVVNLLSVFALADMLRHYFSKTSLRSEWFPFLLSAYFMVILTQQLVAFYEVPFAGMTISLVYAGLALAWCIFGFVKRFTFMRRFGLGLVLSVVSKIFLIDLWRLTEGYRVITYFALGITILGISFVYQHFTKKLDSVRISEESQEN
jgi:uncharacterized membrane protein